MAHLRAVLDRDRDRISRSCEALSRALECIELELTDTQLVEFLPVLECASSLEVSIEALVLAEDSVITAAESAHTCSECTDLKIRQNKCTCTLRPPLKKPGRASSSRVSDNHASQAAVAEAARHQKNVARKKNTLEKKIRDEKKIGCEKKSAPESRLRSGALTALATLSLQVIAFCETASKLRLYLESSKPPCPLRDDMLRVLQRCQCGARPGDMLRGRRRDGRRISDKVAHGSIEIAAANSRKWAPADIATTDREIDLAFWRVGFPDNDDDAAASGGDTTSCHDAAASKRHAASQRGAALKRQRLVYKRREMGGCTAATAIVVDEEKPGPWLSAGPRRPPLELDKISPPLVVVCDPPTICSSPPKNACARPTPHPAPATPGRWLGRRDDTELD